MAQLLDLTRSRIAGGITLDKAPVDLGGVVSEVVDELRRAYPGRHIAWAGGAGVHADADRDRLAQVVSNLVGNALEHGDPARPVTVDLSTRREDVDADRPQPRTARSRPTCCPCCSSRSGERCARSERSRGLGLGLFITEQIVQAHGGRVEVDLDGRARHDVQRRPAPFRR